MPPVPFKAEPLAALQSRYHLALINVYDQAAILKGATRPGEVPAQVFDFEDGLRLIVSRDRLPDGKIVLHVSASFEVGSKIHDELRQQVVDPLALREMLTRWIDGIPDRFAELAREKRPPIEFIGWHDVFIPHWHREEKAQVPS